MEFRHENPVCPGFNEHVQIKRKLPTIFYGNTMCMYDMQMPLLAGLSPSQAHVTEGDAGMA